MTNTQDIQYEAIEMAYEIIDNYPEANALRLGVACFTVITMITKETGNGDLAINIGNALIDCGESENAKSGN